MVNSPLIRPYFLGGWHRGGTLRFPWNKAHGNWKCWTRHFHRIQIWAKFQWPLHIHFSIDNHISIYPWKPQPNFTIKKWCQLPKQQQKSLQLATCNDPPTWSLDLLISWSIRLSHHRSLCYDALHGSTLAVRWAKMRKSSWKIAEKHSFSANVWECKGNFNKSHRIHGTIAYLPTFTIQINQMDPSWEWLIGGLACWFRIHKGDPRNPNHQLPNQQLTISWTSLRGWHTFLFFLVKFHIYIFHDRWNGYSWIFLGCFLRVSNSYSTKLGRVFGVVWKLTK